MKHHIPKSLTLNTPTTSAICSVKAFGRKWSLYQTLLSPEQENPLLFVYPHDNNPWATDLITRFQSDLSAWYEGDTLPHCEYIAASDDRSELQEQILEHPLITGKGTQQASHIITIGDWCSHEVARIRQSYFLTDISQIFCVQTDPKEIDLLLSTNKAIPNTSGVYGRGVSSYQKQIRSLKSIHGNVKTVGILFAPHSAFDMETTLEQAAAHITQECESQGLATRLTFLSARTNPTHVLEQLAGKVDAIITLRDTTAYRYMDDIITFCNTHGITLVTSELASVYRGAALGFGNAPGMYAPHMVRLMVQERLTKECSLDQIPVQTVTESERMTHNRMSLEKQGISLSAQQEDLLDMISVYEVAL